MSIPRCEVCNWPLAASQQKGCIPGDCSYRPDDPAEQARIRRRREELSASSPFSDPKRIGQHPKDMRRVVLESPFAGDIQANIEFARSCIRDCLIRGEAPIASHLLLTQDGILDDTDPDERAHGINAGHAWFHGAHAVVVYTDRGISPGMKAGISTAEFHGIPVEYRKLFEGDE